jgi:hypothetical protein
MPSRVNNRTAAKGTRIFNPRAAYCTLTTQWMKAFQSMIRNVKITGMMVFLKGEKQDSEEKRGEESQIATPQLSTNAPSETTSTAFISTNTTYKPRKNRTTNAIFFRHVVSSKPQVGEGSFRTAALPDQRKGTSHLVKLIIGARWRYPLPCSRHLSPLHGAIGIDIQRAYMEVHK